jgi:hypothetical protein
MFIAAHLFSGALLGLVFRHLANDRRAVPLCMAGSVIPDLIDKPLGLVFPFTFGGGRTVFHSLIIAGIILLCVFIFVRKTSWWPGAGVACAVLLHQVSDEMWMLPANWFYPLFGPFQGQMIPDYFGFYFWTEMSNPSEWLFMTGAVIILAESYHPVPLLSRVCQSARVTTGTCTLFAAVFLVTGVYLVIAGITGATPTLITPYYSEFPTIVAALLALCGAFVMSRHIAEYRRS